MDKLASPVRLIGERGFLQKMQIRKGLIGKGFQPYIGGEGQLEEMWHSVKLFIAHFLYKAGVGESPFPHLKTYFLHLRH